MEKAMPSYSGEVALDRPDLPFDARAIAAELDARGSACFHYAAFGTGWRMLVIDQEHVEHGNGHYTRRRVEGLGRGGGFTLWLRETGNHMQGPWLNRKLEHVPPYLAEKFDVGDIDGYGIAVLISLVDGAREGVDLEETAGRIRTWADRLERSDSTPRFMERANA